MNFKQIVVNILTEEALTSRCKFQPGDIVIIRAAYRAATRRFLHTVATVENDRQTGNQLILYKVKVNNGESHYVSSNRLDGPFKDLEVAQKYIDPNITIDTKDLILRTEVLSDWQKRPKTENQLKNVLTAAPFHFIWNEPPVEAQEEAWTRGYTDHILGYSPLTDKIRVIRRNSKKTKKLTTDGYLVCLPDSNIFNCMISNDHGFYIGQNSPSDFMRNIQQYTESFKLLKALDYNFEQGRYIVFNRNMIKHIVDEFPSLNIFAPKANHYSVVRVYLDTLTPDALSDIEVSDLSVVCNSHGNLVGCPDTVHGDFEVFGKLKSLEGCPKHIENDFVLQHVTSADISSIDLISDYPEYIGGNLRCPRMSYDECQNLHARIQRLKSLQDSLPDAQNDPELSDLF
jgi:hypothetical protein